MPSHSKRSLANLAEAHPALRATFTEVIKTFDHTVIEGFRGQKEQDAAFHAGKSKLRFPASKHNQTPSLAVDVRPYPIDWNDRKSFYLFAGYVLVTARGMGVQPRWGGDWDGDLRWKDQSFHDLPHFELLVPGPYVAADAVGSPGESQ
jgi:peptidoglycan L-alanyl-D-glutamate endopeptidase CwlK